MSDYMVTTEEYRGYKIEVMYDTCGDSPRNWSNVATFVSDNGYGDVQGIDSELDGLISSYMDSEEIIEYFCKLTKAEQIDGDVCELTYRDSNGNLYEGDDEDELAEEMLSCMGIDDKTDMLNTTDYVVVSSGFWYSRNSKEGLVYVERKTAEKEGMLNPDPEHYKDWKEWANKMIDGELETYEQYLNGEVYGYQVSGEDGYYDSCFGYYDMDYMLSEVKCGIDSHIKAESSYRQEALEAIRNNMEKLACDMYSCCGILYGLYPTLGEQPYRIGYVRPEKGVIKNFPDYASLTDIELNELPLEVVKIMYEYLKTKQNEEF